MSMPQKISTCLWFQGNAEEAVAFYISLFEDSRVLFTQRYGDWGPGPVGSVAFMAFELAGTTFQALNGGAPFAFSEAMSMFVHCDDQAEIDRLWAALSDGGQEIQCGWLKDRYGVAWQIVPRLIGELMMNGDPERNDRMMNALMQMVKIDVAALEAAYNGN